MNEQLKRLASTGSYIAIAAVRHDGIPQIIDELKKEYVAEGFEDFDYVEIFGDSTQTEDAVSRSMAPPMISKRKLIVLKNPEALSKSGAEEINKTFSALDGTSLAVIVSVDEFAGSIKNATKEIEERFPGAKVYQHLASRGNGREEMRSFVKEKNLRVSETALERLFEKCDGNMNNIINILNMRYISGEEEIADFDVETLVDMDFSQNLQYRISDNFFRRDARASLDSVEKVIKWNVMNIDGIVLLLMREIEKVRNPFRNEYGFVNNEAKRWKAGELDSAFEMLYLLLRDLRTYSGAFSSMLLQQCIINIIERG